MNQAAKQLNNQTTKLPKGQSLVEALVALAATVLVVTGVVALGIQTVRGAVNARNRAFAYQKAQEEMELVRALRDQDYSSLGCTSTTAPAACSASPSTSDNYISWSGSSWVLISLTRETVDGMQRWFQREDIESGSGQNRCRVAVCVQWSEPSGLKWVRVETVLTNWR